MTAAVCLGATGWVVALALGVTVLRLRRRFELVAEASHELRGPVTAVGFAVAALRREPGGMRPALAFEAQLTRMRAGLEDLEAARSGRRRAPRPEPVGVERLTRDAAAAWRPAAHSAGRRLRFRWEGGPVAVRADAGRLAQAFGNLLGNALEHGGGPVELSGRRDGDSVRVEVRDRGGERTVSPDFPASANRGRGLTIAARAVTGAGGSLSVEHPPEGGTVAAIELPVAEP